MLLYKMDGPVNFACVVGSSTAAVEAVDMDNQIELYAEAATATGMTISKDAFATTFYPLAGQGVNTFQLAADDIAGIHKPAVKLNGHGDVSGWEQTDGSVFNFVSSSLAKMSTSVAMSSWSTASLVNVKKSLSSAKNLNDKSNPAHCVAALDADELATLLNERSGGDVRTAAAPVNVADKLVMTVRVENASANIPDIEFLLNYTIG